MIQCPQCNRENEDTYTYCLGCGTKLPKPEPEPVVSQPAPPTMVACDNCGASVPSNFKFCGACGSPVKAKAASDAVPSIPDYAAETAPRDAVSVGIGGASTSPITSSAPPMAEPTRPRVDALAIAQESTPHTGSVVAKLVVIQPDGTEGATISLQEGDFTIGSTSEHETLANDPFLSPNHAVVTVQGGTFKIRDLDSLNGIFYRINEDIELETGDFIRLGQELLRFEYMEDVEPIPALVEDAETLRGGSPNNGYWGRLSLVSGPDIDTRAFAFSEDEINLGREVGDIVFREDGFVSGRHARLYKVGERAKLKDLGSSNGTYIRIRNERTLNNGDLILMGQQLFRLIA